MLALRVHTDAPGPDAPRRRWVWVALGAAAVGGYWLASQLVLHMMLRGTLWELLARSAGPYLFLLGMITLGAVLGAAWAHPRRFPLRRFVVLAVWCGAWWVLIHQLDRAVRVPMWVSGTTISLGWCAAISASIVGVTLASAWVFVAMMVPALLMGADRLLGGSDTIQVVFYYGWHAWTGFVLAAWALGARLRLRPRGCCAACGYDMRGIDTGVCPECGAKGSVRA